MMKFYTITMVFFALFLYGQKPVSKFSASSASSGSNITVNYNNESTASPTSYSWEFSGGTPSTSTSASPAVSYSGPGNKTKLSLVIPPKISENDSEVDIFPNPVKDYIHVDFKNNKESEYVIYDMAGSILKRGIISEGKINISDLTNGVYILSIKNISRIFKIIKQ